MSEVGTRVGSKDNKTRNVPPGEACNLIIQFSVVTNKGMRLGTRKLEVGQSPPSQAVDLRGRIRVQIKL